MSVTTIKVTSKNQITLPAEYVKKQGISNQDRLLVEYRGDAIIIKPQDDLIERMQKHWAYAAKKMKRPLTDEELDNAARDAYAAQK